MSGVGVTFYLWVISLLYESRTGSNLLPWYVNAVFGLAFFFYACYRVWLEQDRTILNRDHDLLNREREIRKLQEALYLQLDDTIQKIAIGPKSQFSPPAKLALLQRKEYELWLELETVELEDKPLLIKRLEQILELQLDFSVQVFQLPSSNYQEQFNKVVLKLEELRDLAKRIKL